MVRAAPGSLCRLKGGKLKGEAMIKIAQLLCPSRHCFMAIAFDGADRTDDEGARLLGEASYQHMVRNGWKCALCGSMEYKIEIGETRFATMEQALPAIRACETDQLATRAYLTGPQTRN